ncbi:helix-turn-helix domain-containing protein [Neobacillus drentensis]|uniref:helix-turn-helix domain-containing protein n=1 Tax=Neobacillus drentensis TaxID=220684 RepID=UPI0030019EC3
MLTTKKVSEMVGVSEETVRRWIRSGELEAEQDGKSYKIDQGSLIKLLDKKAKEPGNSISKMAALMNCIEGDGVDSEIIASKLIEVGAAVVAKNISLRRPLDQVPEDPLDISILDINNLIYFRKIEMRKLEHEYELKLLEIEEEIAKYELLKQQKLNEKGGSELE